MAISYHPKSRPCLKRSDKADTIFTAIAGLIPTCRQPPKQSLLPGTRRCSSSKQTTNLQQTPAQRVATSYAHKPTTPAALYQRAHPPRRNPHESTRKAFFCTTQHSTSCTSSAMDYHTIIQRNAYAARTSPVHLRSIKRITALPCAKPDNDRQSVHRPSANPTIQSWAGRQRW